MNENSSSEPAGAARRASCFAGIGSALAALILFAGAAMPADAQETVAPESEWFQIQKIDDQTYMIKEVNYWQYNVNYLILGSERAILFDSGPGVYSIRKVVETLTDLPVTVFASHLHFDHVGNHNEFDHIALPDMANLRDQTVNGRFWMTEDQHLYHENISFPVAEWWADGDTIDLGDRTLEVLFVPGHMKESDALWDADNNQLFLGDYMNMVGAWAIVPSYSLEDYLTTADKIVAKINGETQIWEAHGDVALNRTDVENMQKEAQSVIDGTGKGQPLKIGALSSMSYQNFGRIPLIVPANEGEVLEPVMSLFEVLAIINPNAPQ